MLKMLRYIIPVSSSNHSLVAHCSCVLSALNTLLYKFLLLTTVALPLACVYSMWACPFHAAYRRQRCATKRSAGPGVSVHPIGFTVGKLCFAPISLHYLIRKLLLVLFYLGLSIIISSSILASANDVPPLPPLPPLPGVPGSQSPGGQSNSQNITEISPPSGGMSTANSRGPSLSNNINVALPPPPLPTNSTPTPTSRAEDGADSASTQGSKNSSVPNPAATAITVPQSPSGGNHMQVPPMPEPILPPGSDGSIVARPSDVQPLSQPLPSLPPIQVPQILPPSESGAKPLQADRKPDEESSVMVPVELSGSGGVTANQITPQIIPTTESKPDAYATTTSINMNEVEKRDGQAKVDGEVKQEVGSSVINKSTVKSDKKQKEKARNKENKVSEEKSNEVIKPSGAKVKVAEKPKEKEIKIATGNSVDQKSIGLTNKASSSTSESSTKPSSAKSDSAMQKGQSHRGEPSTKGHASKKDAISNPDNDDLPEFTLPDEETTAMLEEFQPEVFPRHTYDYRQNVLPADISKKNYGQENSHLPKAFYKSEYSTLLFAAVKSDDVSSIKALLTRGGEINFRDPNSGYTPLMYAVRVYRIKALRYLITKGANINSIANDGRTAMHLAAMSRNTEAMKVLMSANANVMVADTSGKRPADYIANAPSNVIIELIGNYSDMNRALLDFTRIGSVLAVQYAINHGANLDARDGDGSTALIIAVTMRNIKILSLLIQAGADIGMRDLHSKTPFQIAVEKGYSDVANIIQTVLIQRDMVNQCEHRQGEASGGAGSASQCPMPIGSKKGGKVSDVASGYSMKDYPSQGVVSLQK